MYCRARTAPCTLIEYCRALLHAAVLSRQCVRAESHASSVTGTRARNSEPALGRVSAGCHAIAGGGLLRVGRGQDRGGTISCRLAPRADLGGRVRHIRETPEPGEGGIQDFLQSDRRSIHDDLWHDNHWLGVTRFTSVGRRMGYAEFSSCHHAKCRILVLAAALMPSAGIVTRICRQPPRLRRQSAVSACTQERTP